MRHDRIKESVAQVHAESHGIYGSLKIVDQLQKRDDLESACRFASVIVGKSYYGWRCRLSG